MPELFWNGLVMNEYDPSLYDLLNAIDTTTNITTIRRNPEIIATRFLPSLGTHCFSTCANIFRSNHFLPGSSLKSGSLFPGNSFSRVFELVISTYENDKYHSSIFKMTDSSDKIQIFKVTLLIITIIMVIIAICISLLQSVVTIHHTQGIKEGMAPAHRFGLASSYAKIPSERPRRVRFENDQQQQPKQEHQQQSQQSKTKDVKEGMRNVNLYPDPIKAGNKTNYARGGLPPPDALNEQMKKPARLDALEMAKLHGDDQAHDADGGRSDIVPMGTSARFAGQYQNLSPLVGITSAHR